MSEEEPKMKVSLKSTLNNITEKENTIDKTIAKKEKNKLTYQIGDDSYLIKIISQNKIVLTRNNSSLECTMYFEKNKKTFALYTLKEEGYNLEIEIKTTYLELKDNIIEIKYTVTDSNTNYEYKIEMSEIK